MGKTATMSSRPIRVLIVDADPVVGQALAARLEQVGGIEVVSVARSRQTAIEQTEATQPHVLLVDLMLPGYRSIEIVRDVAGTQSQVRILALSPAVPPHDRIMLATQAGALGYVCRDAAPSEFAAAIWQVHQGEPWLPLRQTYEVLQEGAGELEVLAEQRRDRLTQILLGLIPLTGLVAGITAYLWRQYWGAIGVRVVDLGVDPTTRMIDLLFILLVVIGVFGPLLFVGTWVRAVDSWIEGKPWSARLAAKAVSLRLGNLTVGRLVFSRRVAWGVMALLVLSVMLLLYWFAPLIVVLFFGPVVGIVLVVNLLDLTDQLPPALRLPRLDVWRVVGSLGVVVFIFLFLLGAEVMILGPDLRPDGLHGILALTVLGFRAHPVMLFDLEQKEEPLGALYPGGNADLYVLYDPCEDIVRFVPVGSSRVEFVDQVTCPSP
jgi:DNA-binding NarL/FixJ family response regulator